MFAMITPALNTSAWNFLVTGVSNPKFIMWNWQRLFGETLRGIIAYIAGKINVGSSRVNREKYRRLFDVVCAVHLLTIWI